MLSREAGRSAGEGRITLAGWLEDKRRFTMGGLEGEAWFTTDSVALLLHNSVNRPKTDSENKLIKYKQLVFKTGGIILSSKLLLKKFLSIYLHMFIFVIKLKHNITFLCEFDR